MAYQIGHALGRSERGNADSAQSALDLICVRQPNGCGPHGILGDIIPDCPLDAVCFTAACNEHDICYTLCGTSKEECDRDFYDYMTGICADAFDKGDDDRQRCMDLAYVYWQVVVRYAQVAFDNGQVWACGCGEVLEIPARRRGTTVLLPEIARPFEDGDDDLLPDDWELRAGLDPWDPDDAMDDADGDGLVNLQEFIHGTDPCRADTDGVDDRRPVEGR